MTKYQIDPHPTVWDGTHQLSEQTLDDYVEQLLAEDILDHQDASCLNDAHIEAAKNVLDGPNPGGEA